MVKEITHDPRPVQARCRELAHLGNHHHTDPSL